MEMKTSRFMAGDLIKEPDGYLDRYIACNDKSNMADRCTWLFSLGLQTIKNGWTPDRVSENKDILDEILKTDKDEFVIKTALEARNKLTE